MAEASISFNSIPNCLATATAFAIASGLAANWALIWPEILPVASITSLMFNLAPVSASAALTAPMVSSLIFFKGLPDTIAIFANSAVDLAERPIKCCNLVASSTTSGNIVANVVDAVPNSLLRVIKVSVTLLELTAILPLAAAISVISPLKLAAWVYDRPISFWNLLIWVE